ncbi:hypothetical protein BJY04DRAFT_187699 [Aspergillus karnatakaensis]|uniref:uS17 family ribosomal protein n=1 Tax=Aspergillus karnatakaensis TaxID=1810916 RepID=UPI003CCCCCB4
MSPSYILRAMQPLRSATMRSTSIFSAQAPAALQCSRIALYPRRLNSTIVEGIPQQQEVPLKAQPEVDQESQEVVQEELAKPIKRNRRPQGIPIPYAVPPSLRSYPYTIKAGTVVSVGRMDRTVRVDHHHKIWDKHLRKTYPKTTTYMVADPQNSLREGDVIEFSSGYPKTRHVRHVVERIIAPFGEAIEDRPLVLTREERDAKRFEKRAAKTARREARRENGEDVPEEHIGRIRRLVLERTVALKARAGAPA